MVDESNAPEDLDDPPEPEPPAARRVAQRALVLAAVTCRGALEVDAGKSDAEAFRRDVLVWLTSVGALAEAEGEERRMLESPLGTLDERRVIDATWRGEGLGVLAWALGRSELPSYQETVRPPEVADSLGFMEASGDALLNKPTLRSPAELETLARRLFALHWRLREFTLRPRPMDFASFARTGPFGPLDVSGLAFAKGDLAIDGRPLASVDERRRRECLSIARERQQAANWLCGQEHVYSDVGCDT